MSSILKRGYKTNRTETWSGESTRGKEGYSDREQEKVFEVALDLLFFCYRLVAIYKKNNGVLTCRCFCNHHCACPPDSLHS